MKAVHPSTSEKIQQQVSDTSSAIKAAAAAPLLAHDVQTSIRQLVEGAAGSADEVAYGMRVTMSAVASSLAALGAASANHLLQVLQIAATSACLTAMIAQPEKAGDYEELLAAIRRLV